jgi:hypothetical protein
MAWTSWARFIPVTTPPSTITERLPAVDWIAKPIVMPRFSHLERAAMRKAEDPEMQTAPILMRTAADRRTLAGVCP